MTLEDVKARLTQFGYTTDSTDETIINFIMTKIINEVKRDCNISLIPSDLDNIVIDMIVGEFLLNKKSISPANFIIDLSSAIKQVEEGDTTITFAIGSGDLTPEKRLDNLIEFLINGKREIFNNVRCLSW